MSTRTYCFLLLVVLGGGIGLVPAQAQPAATSEPAATEAGWQSLFDGESLAGWTDNEHPDSCQVEDGALRIGGGERSHLFYTGPVGDHDFKNFELRLKVKTKPGSNSGIYFHTKYQDGGWPEYGYECQVNNSQEDWRRTGSLYGIQDVKESPAVDNEWFDYLIRVVDDTVTITVNGKTTVEFTEGADMPHFADSPHRRLGSGTIALQAHDPGSVVYYKDIEIQQLPD